MKFIKNKKKCVFWAILVSFGLSISNVWAMKEEEDPESAAMMAASSPGMVTPPSRLPISRLVPGSVRKVPQDVPNYCKNVIDALNSGNEESAKRLLIDFYYNIPTFLTESPRNFDPRVDLETREESKKSDIFKYHASLFYCLAMCIANACDKDISDFSKTQKIKNIKKLMSTIKIIKKEDHKLLIKLNVKTVKNKYYSITFVFSVVASGALAIDIRIKPIAGEGVAFVDISNGYNSFENFFKKTTTALVPSLPGASDLSGVSKRIMEASTSSDVVEVAGAYVDKTAVRDAFLPAQAHDLENRLFLVFKAIPFEFRVHLERYSQLILYSLIKFMGGYTCDVECPAGEGRADLVIKTERDGAFRGCIIELKRRGNAYEPMHQIKKNFYSRYFQSGISVTILALSIMTSEERDQVSIKCLMGVEKIEYSYGPIIYYMPEPGVAPSSSVAPVAIAPQSEDIADKPAKKKQKKEDPNSEEEKSEGEQK